MVAKESSAWSASLCRELTDLRRRLELYRVCVAVVANALRHQNAELDTDIAMALMGGAGDPLLDEVERIEQWLARMRREGGAKPRREGKKPRR